MDFQFAPEQMMTAEVSIDDIGNCAIEAVNDLNEQYYLVTKTVLGKTKICTFGPVLEDIESSIFNLNYYTTDYNAKKIQKTIYMFLNNNKTALISATIIDEKDALDKIPSIKRYIEMEEE